MFKLLHSKLFRQNLFKWIFMYIAALGLLTSVITYSKYITALIHDESVPALALKTTLVITSN